MEIIYIDSFNLFFPSENSTQQHACFFKNCREGGGRRPNWYKLFLNPNQKTNQKWGNFRQACEVGDMIWVNT